MESRQMLGSVGFSIEASSVRCPGVAKWGQKRTEGRQDGTVYTTVENDQNDMTVLTPLYCNGIRPKHLHQSQNLMK